MCRISSSPKETVSRAPGLGNRKSCKNSSGEFARTRPEEGGRDKARPVCSLSISSSSTSEPRSRLHERPRPHERPRSHEASRGADARCAPGKNGGFPLTILKPRAEGYETEIVANLAFRGPINHVTCMRKPQALNALTVWVFASDETPWHFTARRTSSTEAVAEVQMDDRKDKLGQKIATTKGNVTAS